MGEEWRAHLDASVAGAAEQVERDADTFFATDIPAILSWDFAAVSARKIEQPTLYVGGTGSGPWFSQVRTLMLGWLPDPEEVVVAGADHNLAVTHPREIARAIAAFVGSNPIP
jgi:pimeloyl-ACP methyl ester carboxylesterase